MQSSSNSQLKIKCFLCVMFWNSAFPCSGLNLPLNVSGMRGHCWCCSRQEVKQRFGITLVFLATRSGLTRWQHFPDVAGTEETSNLP